MFRRLSTYKVNGRKYVEYVVAKEEDSRRPTCHKSSTIGRRRHVFYPLWMTSFIAVVLLVVSSSLCVVVVEGQTVVSVQFNFTEEQPIGSTVGRIPTKSNLSYRLSVASTLFALDQVTRTLTSIAAIDRDALPSDDIDLLVQSIPSPPAEILQVRITILDINDNSPTFPQRNVTVSFDEIDQPGARIILDAATDPDEGPNGTVVGYQIVSGDPYGQFRVTPDSFVSTILYLENVVQLRRSIQSRYTLNISCRDLGVPPRSGFLRVYVTVTDANDHPPVFEASVYHVVVNESAPYGTIVALVRATDADSGANALVTYSIVDGNQASQFTIDGQTGVLTTAVAPPLSCSTTCDQSSGAVDPTCRTNSCLLTVQAQDGGLPYPHTATAQVSVVVIDVNDQAPVIVFRNRIDPNRRQVVDAGAAEGTIVEAVSVTDADSGPNGQTSVRVAAGNERGDFVFAASPLSGLYFLRVGANRLVSGTVYNLTIVASDAGIPPLTTSAAFLIVVAKTDTGPPIFDASFYSASLSEISPVGSYVASVNARPPSAIINVTYSILSGNYGNWFVIDSNTGLITTRGSLDWSQRQLISLLVQAATSASSTTGLTNVTISILRGFRTPPQFTSPVYYFTSIFTSSRIPLQLGTVSASVENGGSVTYQFADHVQYDYPYTFQISRSSGRISTLRSLSFGSTYFLIVEAVNPLTREKSACSVYINVTSSSSNSIPVVYPSLYFVRVTVSLPSATPFVQVRASFDSSRPVFYSLSSVSGGSASRFAIDPPTGWISAVQSLASRTVYPLTVSVSDSSGLVGSQRAVVQVFVSGVSTGPPVSFDLLSYSFQILEDDGRSSSLSGRNVGQVSARADGSSRVSYFIVDGDPLGNFSIGNSTGIISTASPIDREQKSSYNLTVVASTGSDFAVVLVFVSITDLNDNVPQFLGGASTETEIFVDAAVGQDCFIAAAVDADSGVNGAIRYSLNGSSSAFFSINTTSGLLAVAVPLTQLLSDFVVINVVATNPTVPPLTSSQTINVFVVTSYDDVTLMFNTTEMWLDVDESIPVSTRFFSVASALIVQQGASVVSPLIVFSVVRYQGVNDGQIRLFPDGSLYNVVPLNCAIRSEYRLTVKATDYGTSRNRSAMLDVVIVVQDANDHSPVFSNVTYRFSIVEKSSADQFAEVVIATDADRGRNADLVYAIIEPHNGFVIDPISGLLTTLNIFDREQLIRDTMSDTLTFQVSATDSGLPVARSGQATVHVVVVDVNDEPPIFHSSINEASVLENATVNSTVLQVNAVDPDAGPNGDVSYFFIDNLQTYSIMRSVHFDLDPTSGLITVATPPDAIRCNFYTFVVMAIDNGYPIRLNSTAIVRINVVQTFQRTPVWTSLPDGGVVQVGRRSPVGSWITSVTADNLSRDRTPIIYTVVAGTSGLPFALEGSTGKVFLSRPLDGVMPGAQFQVTLEAAVGLDPRVTMATTQLRFIVVDYNTFDTPQFSIDDLRVAPVSVTDGLSPGSTIFAARAVLARLDINANMSYSIVRSYPPVVVAGGLQLFNIDPDSGVVTVTDAVDRERAATYQLVVSAFSRAAAFPTAALTAEHLFTVVIDNGIPEFISTSTFIVPPNMPLGGRPVAVVQAVSSIVGSAIRYAITSGNSSIFQIDSVTGSIYSSSVMLSSTRNYFYPLTISATSINSIPSKTSVLQVNVIVANAASVSDVVPVFSMSSYAASVEENSPASTSVVTVSANYRSRSPPSMQIRYYITSISGSADLTNDGQRVLFTVDATSGLITTTRQLDRETSANVFYVQIVAIDIASTSTPRIVNSTVMISVVDVNDTPPVFISYSSVLSVSEGSPIGTVVGSFIVSDPDLRGAVSLSVTCGLQRLNAAFFIDSTTGNLQVASRLSRANSPRYSLCITANDGTYNTTVNVSISVITPVPGDFTVRFALPVYTFDVPEQAVSTPSSGGVNVGLLSVVPVYNDGLDVVNLTRLSANYRIMSNSGSTKFTVDKTFGVISLVGSVDYETLNLYAMVVECDVTVNSSLMISATTTVYINVLDVNDNAPTFNVTSSYVTSIAEDAPVGSTVAITTASDLDSGANGQVSYDVINGDPEMQFAIDSVTGVIVIAKPLDRESKPYYSLTIEAVDQHNNPRDRLSSTVVLSVVVLDVNDFSPVFPPSSFVSISENVPIGTPVYTASATDPDGTSVTYRLGGIGSLGAVAVFAIGPADGLLTVGQTLLQSQYNVSIIATDSGIPSRSSVQLLTVFVVGVNVHTPALAAVINPVTIPENLPVGSAVMTFSATDLDAALAGEVRYDLVAGDETLSFALDGLSGVLTLDRQLNVEVRSRFWLTIAARDLGSPARSSNTTVSVIVTQSYVRPPSLTASPFVGRVYENLVRVPPAYVTRVTVDSSTSTINYAWVDSSVGAMFNINGSTGVVTSLVALDRETTSQYSFEVIAAVSGNPTLSVTGTVIVTVADANDNAPVFDRANYDARVVENQPSGTTVLQPLATDGDIGRNAVVRYSLVSGTGTERFSIDPWSGLITTTVPLDHEDRSVYTLVVMATDCGLIPLTGTATIQVTVVDLNDEVPQFTSNSYSVVLYQSLKAGDFVTGVTAVDADSGLNGRVRYQLNSSSAFFSIDSSTGVISAQQAISSSFSSATLTVIVSDQGQPPTMNSTLVTIVLSSLASVSFIYPQITVSRSLQVLGSSSVGATIGSVSATTLRPGISSFSFAIVGGNVDDSFAIDPAVGQLSVKRPLQYWRTPSFNLYLQARDNGIPSLANSTSVTVSVTSWNQFSPQFVDVWYNATVVERQSWPAGVVMVSAVDQDLGDSGRVSYALAPDSISLPFLIGKSTGIITTAAVLDRETRSGYQLVVLAYDQGSPSKTASTTVDVSVLGINDNPPVFTELFYASVYENSLIGTVVLRVSATDLDVGDVIRYSMSSSAGGLFAVDPVTGDVTVAGNIDREKNATFALRVAANDGAFNTETSVTIDVLDENDNVPYCSQPGYTFVALETSAAIGNFVGGDSDATAPNNAVFFRPMYWNRDIAVASGGTNAAVMSWRLGGTSFEWIGSGSSMRPSPLNVKTVVLSAVDRGLPTLSSSCSAVIRVLPENRFAPTFSQSSYQVIVPTTATSGFVIMTLVASDNDSFPVNSASAFSLQNAVDAFEVDSQTGVVTLTRSLMGNSSFLATVTDRGNPPKSETVPVFVYVVGATSFVVRFVGDQQAFTATVPEDRPIGYVIGAVRAVYADSSVSGGGLRYFITAGNDDATFAMNQMSGTVSLVERLDYESRRRFEIEVTARDSTATTLAVRKNFTVMVTDVNDNAPVFQRQVYSTLIDEDTPVGTVVVVLNAIDADRAASSALVQYHVVSGNGSNMFAVDQNGGTVTLISKLNYSLCSAYSMTVQAINPGTNLFDYTQVSIAVIGVNWKAPVFELDDYLFKLPNSSSVLVTGTVVGSVSAVDGDSGPSGHIEYYLVGGAGNNYSVSRLSGQIFVSRPMTAPFPIAQLVVMAKNQWPARIGNFDTCSVVVMGSSTGGVALPPVFSQSVYSTSVREDVPVGTAVVQVSVNVFDPTVTATMYAVDARSNVGGAFDIDAKTGLIRVAQRINRVVAASYNLTVFGTVNSVPPLTATAQVLINILPAARPYFIPAVPVATVSSLVAPLAGVVVINLTSYTYCDDSLYTRGPFNYQLVDNLDTFVVDQTSGMVRTAVSLDRSAVSQYDVNVLVNIAAFASSRTSLHFKVIVLDAGDACSPVNGVSSSTCLNGGSCVVQSSGNVCNCISGTRGSDCGMTPKTFQPLSYSEQTVVVTGVRSVNLSFDVATSQPNALVMYAVGELGSASGNAFLAVELIAGMPRISYRQTDNSISRVMLNKTINDGHWYHIDVQFTAQNVSVKVGNCINGMAYCGVCSEGDSTCSVHRSNPTTLLLPVWSLVSVGGVRTMSTILSRVGEVSEFDFAGCLRGVTLDVLDLLLTSSSSSFAPVRPGTCSRQPNVGLCTRNPCANGGICVDEWVDYRCQCAAGFTGTNCSNVLSPLSLSGGSSVVYEQKETYRRRRMLQQALNSATSPAGRRRRRAVSLTSSSISLSFIPTANDGQLVSAVGPDGATYLYVGNGLVSYASQRSGGEQRVLTVDGAISLGFWHNVTLAVSDTGVSLTVDQTNRAQQYSSNVHDPLGLSIQTISIGGSLGTVLIDGVKIPGFSGCMADFTMNDVKQPLDGATDRFSVTQYGRMSFDCPVSGAWSGTGNSEAWKIPVIVVCSIVGFVLLCIIPATAAVLCFRKRRNNSTRVKGRSEDNSVKLNNGSGSGIDEKDTVRRSHSNGRHVSNEIRMMSMQPDVIVPELYQTSVGRKRSTDVDLRYDDDQENDGLENHGYATPEKFTARENQPNGVYRIGAGGGVDLVRRGGNVSLVQSLKNGDMHRSPTRLQYVPPKSSSPHGNFVESGRAISPAKSKSPASQTVGLSSSSPVEAATVAGSRRSTPFSGTPGQDDPLLPPLPPQSDTDFVATGMHRLRSTPTVGLTIDEVNRITDSRRGTPAAAGLIPSTTSSGEDDYDARRMSPDIINRTDFTRDDLDLVVIPSGQRPSMPLSSSSSDEDDTNYDTFTNSDYEYATSRPPRTSDFADPFRLRLPPSSTVPPPQPPGHGRRQDTSKDGAISSAESTMDDSFSMDGSMRPRSAEHINPASSSGRSSVDILQAGELLGWGLRFDLLVGVFNDIAALPDSGGRSSALSGGRSSAARRDDPPSSRPTSNGSGSRGTRTPRQSSAELLDGLRSPSNAVSTYMNAPSVSPMSTSGNFIDNDVMAVTFGSGPSASVTSRLPSSTSEAGNPYLYAQPYAATAVAESRPNSSASRSDASTPVGGTSLMRTTTTPTPVNRNVSPLDMIREDDDVTNISVGSRTRSGQSRNVVLEEYV